MQSVDESEMPSHSELRCSVRRSRAKEGEPKVKEHKMVGKKYSKKTLNTSVGVSPVKRPTKQVLCEYCAQVHVEMINS